MHARDDTSWIYIRNGHITVMVLMYIDEFTIDSFLINTYVTQIHQILLTPLPKLIYPQRALKIIDPQLPDRPFLASLQNKWHTRDSQFFKTLLLKLVRGPDPKAVPPRFPARWVVGDALIFLGNCYAQGHRVRASVFGVWWHKRGGRKEERKEGRKEGRKEDEAGDRYGSFRR